MNRVIAGGVGIGLMGAGLALYGHRLVQETVSLKQQASAPTKVIPAQKAYCNIAPIISSDEKLGLKENEQVPISGIVSFEEGEEGCKVSYKISGLSPGEHAIHINESADADALGSHFNPHKALHGGPDNDFYNRHVGDLGNIKADGTGIAEGAFADSLIKLSGKNSILGRGVVVHANPDDLGKGDNEYSQTTGNSGPVIAFGKIERHD